MKLYRTIKLVSLKMALLFVAICFLIGCSSPAENSQQVFPSSTPSEATSSFSPFGTIFPEPIVTSPNSEEVGCGFQLGIAEDYDLQYCTVERGDDAIGFALLIGVSTNFDEIDFTVESRLNNASEEWAQVFVVVFENGVNTGKLVDLKRERWEDAEEFGETFNEDINEELGSGNSFYFLRPGAQHSITFAVCNAFITVGSFEQDLNKERLISLALEIEDYFRLITCNL